MILMDTEHLDRLPYPEHRHPVSEDCAQRLRRMMFTLDWRERLIVEYRFGMCGSEKMPFREIGSIFRISGNRAAQVFHKAIRKMRHPVRAIRFLEMATESEAEDVMRRHKESKERWATRNA